jgi:polyhydroxyalkanoate synthesis regulator phasin
VELFGLATGEDYYGHETVEGFVERGTATDDDPRALLDQLLSERSVREVELEQEELSEKTLRRLENLGYA